jgi:hypothetical protein
MSVNDMSPNDCRAEPHIGDRTRRLSPSQRRRSPGYVPRTATFALATLGCSVNA